MKLRFRARAVIAVAFVVTLSLAVVPAAQAEFHFMRIREVYPGSMGSAANTNAELVELQMYAPGQEFIGGHEITFYDHFGEESGSFECPLDASHGENQRSILIATPAAVSQFGVGADCLPPDGGYLDTGEGGEGGAVCWAGVVDCMAYGLFANPHDLPVGIPEASGGWASGNSAVRSIAPGCATLLEVSDDTNDSDTDFFTSPTQTPRNNSVTPTEHSCPSPGPGPGPGPGPSPTPDKTAPESQIDKGPKKKVKTRKKKAKVSFEFSSEAGATFECSLDDADFADFAACASPLKVKVKKGKHTFAVRATDAAGNVDQTPDELDFKVKRKKR